MKEEMQLKQAIVVRTDLKMGKGKLATQVAHASVTAFYETLSKKPDIAVRWIKEGQKKVVLKVKSVKELKLIFEDAINNGIIAVMIHDAGLTQLEPGTITSVAIGPDIEEKIDSITGKLKLL